jgi:hypothetical protein
MRAKFDKILVPIVNELIAEDQRGHVTFDAFFANTMFHEVAHGLGIKHVLRSEQTVREALRDHADTIEEAKADVLGLFMITRLHEQGELGQTALENYYVTFLAGVFRSVRFGTTSAHGRANMIRYNFFQERGAFTRHPARGTFRVEMEAMRGAIDALSGVLLKLQGDGDYDAVDRFVRERARVDPALRNEIERLTGIPEDIVFEQGAM